MCAIDAIHRHLQVGVAIHAHRGVTDRRSQVVIQVSVEVWDDAVAGACRWCLPNRSGHRASPDVGLYSLRRSHVNSSANTHTNTYFYSHRDTGASGYAYLYAGRIAPHAHTNLYSDAEAHTHSPSIAKSNANA